MIFLVPRMMDKFGFKMQNQAAVEALYSATFVEDYLDCVENLPSDLQRHLSRLREFDLIQYSEFLKDLESLVLAFEKETTASGQRNVLSKIQHGLIAAQDIGDDKLITVQAMSDLIENKSRQLEHDSKILDFGKDEEDEKPETGNTKNKPETGNTGNQSTPAANTSNSTKNTPTSKPVKEKDVKESGGRGQIKKPRNKKPEVSRSRVSASASGGGGGGGDDREDDEESTKSTPRSGTAASRGPRGGSAGRKRQGVQRKATGKRSNTFPNNKNMTILIAKLIQ